MHKAGVSILNWLKKFYPWVHHGIERDNESFTGQGRLGGDQ